MKITVEFTHPFRLLRSRHSSTPLFPCPHIPLPFPCSMCDAWISQVLPSVLVTRT